MLTKEQAVRLTHGTILYHVHMRNSDRTPVRCRVTGQCKTWATRPDAFRLPVKYGLKQSFYIANENASEWCEFETEAVLTENMP